jgi:glycosyltransferase involved in cell wall biosynthesis
MTTINLVLDEMLGVGHGEISSYTRELARALIDYAPPGCTVEGIVGASPESDYAEISETLPGLHGLFKSALSRRDLAAAWQHGFTPVPNGMVHAPSLLAPLRAHDRVNTRGTQIAVTIHSVTPWAQPDLLTSRQVSWAKAMGQRALKYADAVVVPTHAVADALAEYLPFGDRVRVIGGAVRANIALPADADARADQLHLPETYVLAFGSGTARSGLVPLFAALALAKTEVPLLVVGEADGIAELVTAAGLKADRVWVLGTLSDADLAVALSHASALVVASIRDGFGTTMLEAFSLGTPVIHADAPALLEIADEAGIAVPSGDTIEYPAALAEAIDRLLADEELRRTLGILGLDRAKFFSWRAAAESVWQLHADL